MRKYEHFPENNTCPICGTNYRNMDTVFIPIDGTGEGNNEQAQPFHLPCIMVTAVNNMRLDCGKNALYIDLANIKQDRGLDK